MTNVLLVRAKGGEDVTFICAIHYGDAVVWDQKRRFIKHMLNLRRKKKKRGKRRQNRVEGKGE